MAADLVTSSESRPAVYYLKFAAYRYVRTIVAVVLLILSIAPWLAAQVIDPPGPRAVTTYHYDNYRTGWNPQRVS